MHMNVHNKMVVTHWFNRLGLLYIYIYIYAYHFKMVRKGVHKKSLFNSWKITMRSLLPGCSPLREQYTFLKYIDALKKFKFVFWIYYGFLVTNCLGTCPCMFFKDKLLYEYQLIRPVPIELAFILIENTNSTI
jgi:hypothetical protein